MLLIKGGRVIDPASGRDEIGHLVLKDGKVREFLAGEAPARFQGKVIAAEGKWVVPGLIDMHVHLRDPGFEWKEDIVTGTRRPPPADSPPSSAWRTRSRSTTPRRSRDTSSRRRAGKGPRTSSRWPR